MDRRLAAILSADVAGYSRLLGEDEEATVRALQDHLSAILPLVSEHGGHVIDTAGDGLLAEFPSVVGAVRGALAIQASMAARNEGVAESRRLEFRIGINQGEIVIDHGKAYGDGLNVAARLQAAAEPGGIAASGRVHEDVAGKLDVTWEDLGEQSLKNIARPVRVFRWASGVRAPAAAAAKLPPAILDRPSVAVLPFDNLGDQTGETYFSDGITEDIITGLARFRSLTVIARNSSFAFRGKAVDLTEIGRRLGASYILEGSVRRAANRVRVTAQLIEAATGAHVWAERYDRDLDEVFAVQDELARSIVSTLVGRIQDARLQQSLRKPTSSLAAYDCVLRGVASFRGFGESANQKAYEMFERAVALDPQYAQAHAYLAMAYLALHGHAAAPPEVLDTAFAIASRAIELDPQDSNGHRVVGLVWMYRRDFDSAEHHYRRALELSPDDPDRRMGLGYLLVMRG
jgi:adenylate cyclase